MIVSAAIVNVVSAKQYALADLSNLSDLLFYPYSWRWDRKLLQRLQAFVEILLHFIALLKSFEQF